MKTNVFKKAHEITKKIIRKGDSYRETFRLALIFVYSELKKGANKMIEYVTSKGTQVKIKLNSSKVCYLEVNGIEVVNNDNTKYGVFVTSFDNTIILNDSRYYKKVGADRVVRIEAHAKLMEKYEEAKQLEIKKNNEELDKIKTSHIIDCDFNKHMNDVNNF